MQSTDVPAGGHLVYHLDGEVDTVVFDLLVIVLSRGRSAVDDHASTRTYPDWDKVGHELERYARPAQLGHTQEGRIRLYRHDARDDRHSDACSRTEVSVPS